MYFPSQKDLLKNSFPRLSEAELNLIDRQWTLQFKRNDCKWWQVIKKIKLNYQLNKYKDIIFGIGIETALTDLEKCGIIKQSNQ